MKGLRRILHLPPTFVDRSTTNQRVLDILRDSHQICTDLFSHTWLKRKLLQAFKAAFEMLGPVEEYDYDNPEHQNFVLQNATERQGVFA